VSVIIPINQFNPAAGKEKPAGVCCAAPAEGDDHEKPKDRAESARRQ
jgi:hypothetical protein